MSSENSSSEPPEEGSSLADIFDISLVRPEAENPVESAETRDLQNHEVING